MLSLWKDRRYQRMMMDVERDVTMLPVVVFEKKTWGDNIFN
jgi:hypothetical protein